MPKFTFAHLIGRKAKATEDEDEKTRKAKGRRAEDDDEETEQEDTESEDQDDEKEERKGKKAKSKKADEDEPDAEEDEEEAEEEDEDAEEDDDNKDVKKGRRAERTRCARIFGSKYAAGRPDMAAHFAFNTKMSSSEVISTLKAMGATQPVSSRVTLDSRMRAEQVRVGQDIEQAPSGSAASMVQKMTSLYNSNKGAK